MAGFEVIAVDAPFQLEALLDSRRDIALAILDGEIDADAEPRPTRRRCAKRDRAIPALTVVVGAAPTNAWRPPRTTAPATSTSPGPTRPTRSAGASRPCASGARPSTTAAVPSSRPAVGSDAWSRRATVIAVFNPKGGVGKTTVATNLASSLQARKGKSVLLDRRRHRDRPRDDLVRHRGRPDRRRQLARRGRGRPGRGLLDLASAHGSGLRVVALTDSPIHTDVLDPDRVRRRSPSRGARSTSSSSTCTLVQHAQPGDLRRGGPDPRAGHPGRAGDPRRGPVPRRRPALGCRERSAMVVNRANSGVSVADMERTVGMPGLRPDPVGRPALRPRRQRGPDRHRDVPAREDHRDFDALADRVLGTAEAGGQRPVRVPLPVASQGSRPAPEAAPARRRFASGPCRSTARRRAIRPAASRGARPVRASTCSTPRR